eukprot:CAMPEP_0179073136 /NCGR_PEP_ID=MMETSP0796-20121207/32415_1 /TAXON_ID=73915 /ORGANISM="Pyrodinium bahamense, Strain pbaha01" /LENGTH=108 /DNA_ID=CAMNT_0020770319 /DNA_START=32 /DNA_END=355 /DNA_ORIENTATION=+
MRAAPRHMAQPLRPRGRGCQRAEVLLCAALCLCLLWGAGPTFVTGRPASAAAGPVALRQIQQVPQLPSTVGTSTPRGATAGPQPRAGTAWVISGCALLLCACGARLPR